MSEIRVLKFGGTSVGSAEALHALLKIIQNQQQAGVQLIIVVSAMSGITNELLEAGREAAAGKSDFSPWLNKIYQRHADALFQFVDEVQAVEALTPIALLIEELAGLLHGINLVRENSTRTNDVLLSFGERMSAALVAAILNSANLKAKVVDARQCIKTDARFGKANVQYLHTNYLIQTHLQSFDGIPVVTGFIASTEKGETTTLGRGGSDFTASIIGAALNATEIQIWTDVNGMMTADPRLVKKAITIPYVSYQEAMELSHFGAKVIYPPSLQPAFQKRIPIKILNTFDYQHPGTTICDFNEVTPYPVTGLSSINKITLLNLQGTGMVGVAGIAGRLFAALAKAEVNVILITQASSEHSISLAIDPKDNDTAKDAINNEFEFEIRSGKIEPVELISDLCIIAVIGENMRKAVGVSGKLFTALGSNGINVVATAQGSSERNISIVVPANDMQKALNVLHEAFFLSDKKTLHCFLVGPGLIGSTLLQQIKQQQQHLEQEHHLIVKVCGISNSKRFLIDADGIDLSKWSELMVIKGKEQNVSNFIQQALALNLSNSVVIDCTSSDVLLSQYEKILSSSCAIITPNKLACSSDYQFYKKLISTAQRYNTRFMYETNVGAGLPVIGTLQSLVHSGDKLIKIEAVLSGTLAYIFNTFSDTVPFAQAVKAAKDKGYTEPDPREDLNGKDMARKMLILARESGMEVNMEDVYIENILPQACIEAPDPGAFLQTLEAENAYFEKLAINAKKAGKKLRYLGEIKENKITIRLCQIDSSHPFWNMNGADNIISFYTERYKERPLVIQGPGAGAEVTAAGVFAELISLRYGNQ
jgi:aspartokinase/homoserine dehydrogenase 1